MNEIAQELKRRLEGTDDLSMAKGLAYALLETLTGAAHEISECLFRGETDAEGLLSVIDDNIDYVQHNTAMLQRLTGNFEGLCAKIRKEDNA